MDLSVKNNLTSLVKNRLVFFLVQIAGSSGVVRSTFNAPVLGFIRRKLLRIFC